MIPHARLRWTLRGLRSVALGDRASWRFVAPWLRSLWSSNGPLEDECPWFTYPALGWLERTLHSEMRVFEFGSGGSTLFFARQVAKIISVEHDPQWHDLVSLALRGLPPGRCELKLIEPELATAGNDDFYGVEKSRVGGIRFENYARSIDAYDDHSFDLVVVDGWARLACLRHAASKVKPGGYLLLDNSDWRQFAAAHEWFAAAACQRFRGLGPHGAKPWETTVWQLGQSFAIPAAA